MKQNRNKEEIICTIRQKKEQTSEEKYLHTSYPMKIRVKGTKEIIPIQIIDKEVIEFLRSKLVYTVNPPDFDFDKI